MSSFKEFMERAKTPSIVNITYSSIQSSIVKSVSDLLVPYAIADDERQKFSEEVSEVVQDDTFLSEFSARIGEPRQNESEDEFVERSSDVLRRMLYNKFGIKC